MTEDVEAVENVAIVIVASEANMNTVETSANLAAFADTNKEIVGGNLGEEKGNF